MKDEISVRTQPAAIIWSIIMSQDILQMVSS